jgi:trehalose 6-phosphate synthase
MARALAARLASALAERPSLDTGQAVYVLSQRGPIAFKDDGGKLELEPASGGLATAFSSLTRRRPVHWIAAAVSEADQRAVRVRPVWQSGMTQVHLVGMPETVSRLHYSSFTNPLLWLLQHGLGDRLIAPRLELDIERAWHDGYVPANRLMADRLVSVAASASQPVVLVQDYHLYLVPRLVREAIPGALIAHFVHIPWPDPHAWKLLPRHIVSAILRGLMEADLVGFQTEADVQRFLATCREFAPGSDGVFCGREPGTLIRHYPISVDAADVRRWADQPVAQEFAQQVRGGSDGPVIARVDRLDPSKNIPMGFDAFGLLLDRVPSLRGKARFLAHLMPSRTEIPEYQEEKQRVFEAAQRVNDGFGTSSWQPIEIFYQESRALAAGLLSEADVHVVNSQADGMHLGAKEGVILNRRNAVLVLSRKAGAWEELGRWALGAPPNDLAATAVALERAITMPRGERERRAAGLRRAVASMSVERWLDQQLADLCSVRRTVAWRRGGVRRRLELREAQATA